MIKIKLALSIAVFLFTCSNAWAHKDVGGGNGVGGVLLDRYSYDNTQQLRGADLLAIVKSSEGAAFARFPLLLNLADDALTRNKSWYLDSHPFVAGCLNQSMIVADQDAVACQNEIETRIHPSWWSAAGSSARGDLLVHEIITGLWLTNDAAKPIGGAVASLLGGKDPDNLVQEKFFQAALPIFPTAREVAVAKNLLTVFSDALCKISSRTEAYEWLRNFRPQLLTYKNDQITILLLSGAQDLLNQCLMGANACLGKPTDAQLTSALWNGFQGYYPASFDPPRFWQAPMKCQAM